MVPLISIIVPIYNQEKYLNKCLDSIIGQTFKTFELILIDDGSTDNSPSICDYYFNKDSRIKVFHKYNGGVSSARNKGIELSVGKYIMFIDSDDWIEQEFLEKSVKIIEENFFDWYISGFVEEQYKDKEIANSILYKIDISKIFDVKSLLEAYNVEFKFGITSVWDKLYIAALIKKNNLTFDETMNYGEDANFNLLYLEYCNQIFFDDRIFYHYTKVNCASLSNINKYHHNLFEACVKNTLAFERLSKKSGCNLQCTSMNNKRFNFDILFCIEQEYRFNKPKEQKKKILWKISDYFFKYGKYEEMELSYKLIFFMLETKRIGLIYIFYNIKYFIKFLTKHTS